MKHWFVFFATFLTATTALSQRDDVYEQTEGYVWPVEKPVLEKLHTWQDLKFGVLIHWGLYAQAGIVESWSIACENWITRDTTRTYEEYKQWYWGLADTFRPTRFDPAQWAEACQRGGMRYVLFTTKHHDGFCLWDSHETDFTIARHAFRDDARRDVCRHVFDAFRQHGFMTGAYFSKPDWHSQFYWWDVYPNRGRNTTYDTRQYPWRWQQFKLFTHRQLRELMSGYGPLDILWLDGGWVYPENHQDIDMPGLARMARSYHPGLLIVDRTIGGPYENYQTPERTIPETQLRYPWESCIPLSDDWGYVSRPRWKSAGRVVSTLIEIVAKGGNLVLGVGPTPEGLLQPEVTARLDSIGQWLRANGRAIYETRPTPHYQEGDVFFTQSADGRTVYALYRHPEGQPMPAELSWTRNLPARGARLRLVATGQRLRHRIDADGRLTVTLPKGLPAQSLAIEFLQL